MTPCTETAEQQAAILYRTAIDLQTAMSTADNMAKERWQAIYDEQPAYETLILQGAEVVGALKTLAMRLDRACFAKLDDERRV